MTDRADALERIARLQERRGRTTARTPASGDRRSTSADPIVGEAVEASPAASPASAVDARRRRPATGAKIVTVGASATAMLAMVAFYGAADGIGPTSGADPAGSPGTDAVGPEPTEVESTPIASVPVDPQPASQPDVVVVVVDDESIRSLDASLQNEIRADALDRAPPAATADGPARPASSGGGATPPPPEPATGPMPVPAPASVDLAVPAPPRPSAAPAAPAPVAESKGS